MWGRSSAPEKSPQDNANKGSIASAAVDEDFGKYEEYDDADEGAGSYFAAGFGILVDEKIDYTVDGINYAIDGVSDGIAALGSYVTCGYGQV